MTKKALLACAAALAIAAPSITYADVAFNVAAFSDYRYLDLSATFDVGGGLIVTPHIGYQKIKGPFAGPGSYSDFALTLSKDFSGLVVSGALVGTDADESFYSSPVNGKELGKTGLVVGVKYNF